MNTHIVFGLSSVSAIEQEMHVSNEQVIVVLDDLMWGPLGNILSEDVQKTRVRWWKRVLNDEDFAAGVPDVLESYKKIGEWANTLTEIDTLQCWVANNPSDYTGLMCLITYVPTSISVSVVTVSNSYYKRYGKFKPLSLGEVPPEKLLPMKEDAKTLSQRVREGYIRNWIQLLDDQGSLRIRKNRRIETVPEDFFDEELLTRAKKISQEKMYRKSDGFLPVARLVGEVIGHQKQRVADVLIEWRIRCMIENGLLAYKGSLANMRLYWIKPI